MNSVVLIGRLVRDPELRFVPGSGMAVANFTMAIDKGLTREKKQEFENQGKPTADFIRIVVWGKQAENCSQYLAKGKLVAIQGSIQTSSYKSTAGETRYTTEVLANRVEFLEWGEKTPSSSAKNDDFSFGAGSFEDFQSIEDDDDVPF
ncbi:MAG TPA: single-stranded DNA-binding protein [Clostridiales bacterium UBA8960]|jgi:single-strand DNA-binding protein|nr:single-stranded DNA-binding protein [Clostridiales bacterium UBA8960]